MLCADSLDPGAASEIVTIIPNMLDWIASLHTPEKISAIIQGGGWLIIVGIVFAETGLLVGFFLPGDSLLITAGVLSNPLNPNHIPALGVVWLNISLSIAAFVGDQVGFFLGARAGDAIWKKKEGRFFKKQHLKEAHEFYERYGSWAIIGAKYVPIMRTFVPFVAGMARMSHRKFTLASLFGAIFWITSLIWLGYFLGQTKLANRLDKIIVVVIVVSTIPLIGSVLKRYRKAARSRAS